MRSLHVILTVSVLMVGLTGVPAGADVPPAMNIQGRLTDSTGAPLPPGPKLFTFKIYSDSDGVVEIWPDGPGEDQMIETDPDGLWSATLGVATPLVPPVFGQATRWLAITVNDLINPPLTLPRIQLVTGPYSYRSAWSQEADQATVSLSAAPSSVNSAAIIDSTIAFIDIGQNGAAINQVMKWDGAKWVPGDDIVGMDLNWLLNGTVLFLNGNYGLSRTDNMLWGSEVGTHVNLGEACTTGTSGQNDRYIAVGGGFGSVAAGEAATIGGGLSNVARGRVATVAGGERNMAAGDFSAILGGYADTITATADYSYLFGIKSKLSADSTFMVDMPHIHFGDASTGYEFPSARGTNGQVMTTDAGGQLSWTTPGVGADNDWTLTSGVLYTGGEWGIARAGNVLHGNVDSTHVNLGVACTTGTSGQDYGYATVSGGGDNAATGERSTIGGGGSNTASATSATVGGGQSNTTSGFGATIGGGQWNRARGDYSVVAGGGGPNPSDSNSAGSSWCTIGGGVGNVAWSDWSTIGGGDSNSTNGLAATVAGGMFNKAHHSGTFIGGGSTNLATAIEATIGGGVLNVVSGEYSTIGGGFRNGVDGDFSFIGGGQRNRANGAFSVVGGGGGWAAIDSNSAFGGWSTIGGGRSNIADSAATIGGGWFNRARGVYSVVSGGGGETDLDSNSASGDYATVPGGRRNTAAGAYSFAAGRRAKATHDGTFVWSDSTDLDFTSNTANEFAVHATNGVRFKAENTDYGAQVTNAGNGDGLRVYGNVSLGLNWGAIWATNTGSSATIYANNTGTGDAGYFNGPVTVTGWLTKPGGSFKIDHPLDPENKYLYHSFVESPDMMNVYNGNVVLDAGGAAVVSLPDYFEALNRDFRYQLTAVGGPAPNLYIAEKIAGNRFKIAGGSPGGEVSWQVTGVRKDPYAEANRMPTEVAKPPEERGRYLHAAAYGRPMSESINRGSTKR